MHLKSDVDIVEPTLFDNLLFTAEVRNLALLDKFGTIPEFHVLLGRNGKKDHVAGKFFYHARIHEGPRNGKHVGNLHVMPAAVRRTARSGIRRVFANDSIKFPDNGHGLAGLTALNASLYSRDTPARCVLKT